MILRAGRFFFIMIHTAIAPSQAGMKNGLASSKDLTSTPRAWHTDSASRSARIPLRRLGTLFSSSVAPPALNAAPMIPLTGNR
jgi:hypothetical protein